MNLLKWLIKTIHNVDVDSLISENKRLDGENGRNRSRVRSLQKDKEVLNGNISDIQKQLDATIQDLSTEKNKTKELTQTVENQDKELNILRHDKTVNDKTISELNADIQKLQNDIKGKEDEIRELKDKNAQTPESPSDPESDSEKNDQIEALQRTVLQLQEENKSIGNENRKLKGDICNKDSTINELNKSIEELQKIIESHKTAEEPTPGDDILPEPDNEVIPVIEENDVTKSQDEEPTDGNSHEDEPEIKLEETQDVVYLPDGETIPIIEVDKTKRTIDTVLDLKENRIISAKEFFSRPENYIFKMRTELEKAIYLHKPYYVCKYCGQMVKVSGRKTQRGVARFFSHLRDSDDCDYKTTTGRTRKEIEREKYALSNEGDRHKFLKAEIARYLKMTEGVTNVQKESTIRGNHPILRWRRPDVSANYRGQDVVFELQLSTTFVSVIAERDLFYRLNKTHIIWIFNFDEQAEHVDLTNMMTKDIYYNNHFNIFVFDKEAQKKSEEEGQLYLKCNWIGPDGKWAYKNGNTHDEIHGELIPLSKLHFDNTYKPYYIDAENAFYSANPDMKVKVMDIENENKEIISQLDELWEKEQKENEAKVQRTEKRRKLLLEEYEIDEDKIKKETTTYLIAERGGKWGLVTFDSILRIPFEYEKIIPHVGWIECNKSSGIDSFNKSFIRIESDIKRIEKLNASYDKYVKDMDGNWLWGLMKQGVPVTRPIYSRIDLWTDEKMIAIHNGLYCIISHEGSELISGYDYIGELEGNEAVIEKDGNKGYINGDCESVETDGLNIEGYKKVCQLGYWGIRETNGGLVVPCIYDELGTVKNNLIGLKGLGFSTVIENGFHSDCPVKVEYVTRNERKMMIFKVGKREAFMNLRQQQKATKNGLNPAKMSEMYISHANAERNLLYLSATPVKGPVAKTMTVLNSEIPLGTVFEGTVVHTDKNYIIIKSDNGNTAYIHRSTWGEYAMYSFNKNQRVRAEKVGFDDEHNKHIWKILSVFYAL